MSDFMIGIDEVGLGSLAGPVVAAAVVFPWTGVSNSGQLKSPVEGLNDSKKLTDNRRRVLRKLIMEEAPYWAISVADIELINKYGIKRCHHDCMGAVAKLCREHYPEAHITIDGVQPIKGVRNCKCEVRADGRVPTVSAASIIAKVFRDDLMIKLSSKHPRYAWASNKGYGSPEHMAALKRYGVTPYHRRHYAPVRRLIDEERKAATSTRESS